MERSQRARLLAAVLVVLCIALFPLVWASCGEEPHRDETESARITVHGQHVAETEISDGIYGGFIEFLPGVINGLAGMWAQELLNRGFDEPDVDDNGVAGKPEGPLGWFPLGDAGAGASWSPAAGGYNTRGVYAQSVAKSGGTGRAGLYHLVLLSPPGETVFYVYLKGDASAGEVTARLAGVDGSITLAEASLGLPTQAWSRREVTFPPVPDVAAARLEVFFTGSGEVFFDEASFMSSHNLGGVREQVVELYRELEPGVMRYPGGCFADQAANHWVNGIGPLDGRGSPNWDEHWGSYQRLDFGTDEFVAFCRAVGAEPHIVVNFGDGTALEAAAWVAYANGDPSDASPIGVDGKGTDWRTVGYWAGQRAANGHTEPYSVTYWEIGNEQYGVWENGHTTPQEYGAAFLAYREAMERVDPDIRVVADGHTERSWYEPLMRAIGGRTDVFGWHVCQEMKEDSGQDETYLAMLATPTRVEENIALLWDEFTRAGYSPGMRMSISEWWPENQHGTWSADALEGALWTALMLNVLQRHPAEMETACRTLFQTMFIQVDREDHRREAVLSPSFHASSMYRRYCGERSVPVSLDCGTYAVPGLLGFGAGDEVPYLDVSATCTDGSVTLAVVNRHPYLAFETAIAWEGFEVFASGEAHLLTSASYLDANSLDDPGAVAPVSSTWSSTGEYLFPPHSLTILTAAIQGEPPRK
jgi:alpha-N-arabinofuranosidase